MLDTLYRSVNSNVTPSLTVLPLLSCAAPNLFGYNSGRKNKHRFVEPQEEEEEVEEGLKDGRCGGGGVVPRQRRSRRNASPSTPVELFREAAVLHPDRPTVGSRRSGIRLPAVLLITEGFHARFVRRDSQAKAIARTSSGRREGLQRDVCGVHY